MVDDGKKFSPEEIEMLIEHAGHSLSPEELESLCITLGYILERARRVRSGLVRSDEPATAFRVSAED